MVEPEVAAKNLVVLHNPNASGSIETERLIGTLKERYATQLGFITLETLASQHRTRQQLHEQIPPNSILCVIGGDGTVNGTVETIMDDSAPSHISSTPLLIVGAGNKNDTAHMAHGRYWQDPIAALEQGVLTQVRPIVATFRPMEGKPFKRLALYSFGLGVIGEGARLINNPEFRDAQKFRHKIVKFMAEVGVALKALKDTEPFLIDGQTTLDKTIANGPRMAGGWRFRVRLSEDEMYISTTRHKNPVNIGLTLLDRYAGVGLGRWARGSYTINLGDNVPATADGEDFTAPAGNLHVSHSKKAITLVTKRPDV